MNDIIEIKGYEWIRPAAYFPPDAGTYKGDAVAVQSSIGPLLLVRHESVRFMHGGGTVRTVLVKPAELRDESIITPP